MENKPETYFKDFDRWNIIKKQIDKNHNKYFPKEREVWICILGKNIGHEQDGNESFQRPVLVIKKINNKIFLVLPLTTKQKAFDFYYNFVDPNKLNVSIIFAQIRAVSAKRFFRRKYILDNKLFKEIKLNLFKYLS